MRVLLSELAQSELEDACAYYEAQFPGLGARYKEAIEQTIKRIVAHPKAWPQETGDIRRCLVHKFPYKLLYSLEPDHLFIIAIAHQHRKPDYWIDSTDNH